MGLNRKAHILAKLKRECTNMRVILLDTETRCIEETDKHLEQDFRLGATILLRSSPAKGVVLEETKEHFSAHSLNHEILNAQNSRGILYVLSNNIWFDIRIVHLIPFLLENGYKVDYYHAKGICVIIRLSRGNQKILILNIYQFIPASVEQMGKVLGLPKLDADFDNMSDRELMVYCVRDAVIIAEMFKLWIEYIEKHELGKMGMTLASQAMIAFRKRFMNQEIFIHGNKKLTEFERLGYFGGRTEAFYIGQIPYSKVYCVDVNSMYPFIMRSTNIPYKFINADNDCDIGELRRYTRKYFTIAQVAINTDKNYYPMKMDGKLIFPIGKFVTILCGEELKLALREGHVEHVYNYSIYKASKYFRPYVDYFYNIRQEYKKDGNEVFSYLTKIMLNSLYGKFGQKMDITYLERDVEEIDYKSEVIYDTDTNERWRSTTFGNKQRIYQDGKGEAFNSFPAICAAITSAARCLLLSYMRGAGEGNFFYCDTDSLFVNEQGLKNLSKHINSTKLGKLGIDKEGSEVFIHGAKDYVFDGEETIKGVNKTATKVISGVYDTLQFPGMKSEINSGLDSNYKIKKIRKILSRQYTKAIVNGEGFVSPIILEEF